MVPTTKLDYFRNGSKRVLSNSVIAGVVSPFRGARRLCEICKGMPWSEIALEELVCRVLGTY